MYAMEYWSNGVMEKWDIDYSGSEASRRSGLFSALYHPNKNRSHSIKPKTPTLHYSITPLVPRRLKLWAEIKVQNILRTGIFY
jgi:hypothetical protein